MRGSGSVQYAMIPEEAERGLEDAGEEGGSQGEVQVQSRVLRRGHLAAEHGADEQRRHRHGPHGQVPGAPHQRVHQRRHEARVCNSESKQ